MTTKSLNPRAVDSTPRSRVALVQRLDPILNLDNAVGTVRLSDIAFYARDLDASPPGVGPIRPWEHEVPSSFPGPIRGRSGRGCGRTSSKTNKKGAASCDP